METENPDFLTTQLITYLGNKRSLIVDIEREVNAIHATLGKEKLATADLFAGSGVVARMLKAHSSRLVVNDLEPYSCLINSCYLTNKDEFPRAAYQAARERIMECARTPRPGLITANYAPQDDERIQPGERVFYTHENALIIDTYRAAIDEVLGGTEDAPAAPDKQNLKKFFLAPLITEASVHVNTSGVFKGFYKDKNTGLGCFGAAGKNALTRIKGKIELKEPVFSNFDCAVELHQADAVELAPRLTRIAEPQKRYPQATATAPRLASGTDALDVAYLDPPYNQHPYGSNYFMLNLILKNQLDGKPSRVSGIPPDWNRSIFNKAAGAPASMESIVASLNAAFIIVSYNSEGFITYPHMTAMLQKYGTLKTVELPYNTFRGSRNLANRPIHVSEYLFVLDKR